MRSSFGLARSVTVLTVGLGLLIVMALSAVAGTFAAAPQNAQNPPLNVVIMNTPLPVTGSVGIDGPVTVNGDVGVSGNVGVSGTVNANQAGTWNVGITGNPEVSSGDSTVLLGSFAGSVSGGGVFTEAISGADASGSRSVRVMTNCFAGGACANINVRVYTVVGNRSYLIDQFPMQNFVVAGGVYDVIGTNVSIQLQSSNPGTTDNVGVAVFGRAN